MKQTKKEAEIELNILSRSIPVHYFDSFVPSIKKGDRFNHYDNSYGKKVLIEDIAIEDSYLNIERWELCYGKKFGYGIPIIIR